MVTKLKNHDNKKIKWLHLSALFDEVNRLHYRLQNLEESLQKYEGLDASERSVLYMLASKEATISELAFMRNVTRQRMHQLVKKLEDKKIIIGTKNRRHISSPFYKLSRLGIKVFLRMMKREKKINNIIAKGSEVKYESTAKLLKEIRQSIEDTFN